MDQHMSTLVGRGHAKMIGSIDRLEHSYYYAQLGYPLVHVGCSNIIFYEQLSVTPRQILAITIAWEI
jgi:hypothetical protein